MQIQKPHPGAVEQRGLRTAHSKTFSLPDGRRRLELRKHPVCYVSDQGELRSIDTTIQQANGRTFVEWAPYRFELHKTGVGFDFESREGGAVSVSLAVVGGQSFDRKARAIVAVTGETVTFADVTPGLDIVFQVLPNCVKTLRIVKDAKAARDFEWTCTHDAVGKEKIGAVLFGRDAAGLELDLAIKHEDIDERTTRVTESWSGNVKMRNPETRIKTLSADVVYPVEIDPTVSYDITADTDNVTDRGGTVYDYYLYLGNYGNYLSLGLRFIGVAVPQGATIDSAELSLNVIGKATTYAAGVITGYDTDSASAWASPSPEPSGVTLTTAQATLVKPTTSGIKTTTVTSIVQEIVSRGGWASGNAMSFVVKSPGAPPDEMTKFEHSSSPGTNGPTLSITYTAGGGGGTVGRIVTINQAVRRASTF